MNIRKILPSDFKLLHDWIDADAEHRARGMKPDFFSQPQTLSMMFEDDRGPVFAVRLDPEPNFTVRLHIQFDATQPLRTARMLKEGFPIVRERAMVAQAERLIFESVHEPLVEFCKQRFGFQQFEGSSDLVLVLESAGNHPVPSS